MSWVTDCIAVGTPWHMDHEESLLREGFTHVLVVARGVGVPPHQRVVVSKIPWWEDQSLEELYEAIYFIDQAMVEGRVLVVCRAGLERSPLTVVAYLMYKGYSLEDAVSLVKERHRASMIHLEWLRQVGFLTY